MAHGARAGEGWRTAPGTRIARGVKEAQGSKLARAVKAMGEKPGAMLKENQPFNQMRSELERIHEWYCTNLDGTHDLPLCARWRLRLRGAVRCALTRTPD